MNELILKDFFNQLLWDKKFKDKTSDYDITYIHRGAPGNKKMVNFSQIEKVNSGSFEYYDEEFSRVSTIPFHRILIIKDFKKDEIVYTKKPPSNTLS